MVRAGELALRATLYPEHASLAETQRKHLELLQAPQSALKPLFPVAAFDVSDNSTSSRHLLRPALLCPLGRFFARAAHPCSAFGTGHEIGFRSLLVLGRRLKITHEQ